LRCRYCNKSISLLRRLNDTGFCSDGHRFAYAEEQELAMQRLAENQPAMQRTQRMAAAVRHEGMALFGGHLGLALPVTAGAKVSVPVPDPLPCVATVLFRDPDHSFAAGMAVCAEAFRLAGPAPATQPVVAAQASVPFAQYHHPVSPAFAGQVSLRTGLSAETALLRLAFEIARSDGFKPRVDGQAPLAAVELQKPEPQFRPRNALRPQLRLFAVSSVAPGRSPRRSRELGTRAPGPLWVANAPCRPASRLAPILPDLQKSEAEEFWALLSATPLGNLVAATECLAVLAVEPPRGVWYAPGTKKRVAFPRQPLTLPEATPPVGSGVGLAPRAELQPIPPPAGVSVQPPNRPFPTTLAPSLQPTTPVQPKPAPEHSLPPSSISFLLAPPALAGARPAGAGSAAWSAQAPQRALPAGLRLVLSNRMPGGAALPVDPPPLAGSRPANLGASKWIPAAVGECHPASRPAAPGLGSELAAPVAVILCPGPADAALRKRQPQTLHTVLRVRLPRHSPKLGIGHSGAECVPVGPPSTQLLLWHPAIAGACVPSPSAMLPFPPSRVHSRAPRPIPVRLYPVRAARPARSAESGKPRCFPMDCWGAAPSLLPLRIPFDDGRPKKSKTGSFAFGKELRSHLSPASLLAAWTKLNRLPSDLKWIALVVPLIICIWIFARPASAPASEPAAAPAPAAVKAIEPVPEPQEIQAAVTPVSAPEKKAPPSSPPPAPAVLTPAAEPGRWEILTARIAGRAAVNLVEDFRNGLSHWEGRGEWARSWSYDRSGTVRPGNLAIFQPSIALRDYTMEMKASVERRSIQWLVRATGPQNYHFSRLNVTPATPLTKLEFERWSVINGRPSRLVRLPLPHGGAHQTLYSIRVEVKGDSVTTYLQDQVIDTFSDPRLPDGGVGLVGAQNDRPRIYGLHVFHQNDFLGKLCSFLVPPPIVPQGPH
jgi:hypothetical protein